MYARMSRARIKPGASAEIRLLCQQLGSQNAEFTGLKYWFTLINEAGEVVVLSVFDTRKDRDAAAGTNQRRWADAKHLLEHDPIVTNYEVAAVHEP